MTQVKKYTVYGIQKRMIGYDHWKIILDIDNPNYEGNEEEEDEAIKISTTSTNSRAIDGYDGADLSLAEECLMDNDYDESDFDLSSLDAGEEE